MIELVLDANVALDWFITSEAGEAYSRRLAHLVAASQVRLFVPLHFDVEVAGQLVKHHRRKPHEFDALWLKTALQTLDVSPIETVAIGVNFEVLGDLALAYNVTAYDAPYIHLARLLELPIASRDRGVISAAKAWHVPVWQP